MFNSGRKSAQSTYISKAQSQRTIPFFGKAFHLTVFDLENGGCGPIRFTARGFDPVVLKKNLGQP